MSDGATKGQTRLFMLLLLVKHSRLVCECSLLFWCIIPSAKPIVEPLQKEKSEEPASFMSVAFIRRMLDPVTC
jgi:hypothetical protein